MHQIASINPVTSGNFLKYKSQLYLPRALENLSARDQHLVPLMAPEICNKYLG